MITITEKKSLVMKQNKVYYCLFIILIVCLSCNNRETYFQFYDLNEAKWSKLDTLYFDIDSTLIEPNVNYEMTIELTNDSDYPYQNIWLYVQDNITSENFNRFELQYELADEMGRWYGSGFGALYQVSLNYKNPISFPEKKNYQLKIVQGMRDEPLTGIDKVGVKLTRID